VIISPNYICLAGTRRHRVGGVASKTFNLSVLGN
jgi:hypothetical protein